MAPIFLSLLFTSQLLFSLNFVWGPSMFMVDSVDSMVLYHLILILLSNIFFSVVGLLSQSRYAIIATVRGLVHMISLDIFITVLYSLLVFSSQSAFRSCWKPSSNWRRRRSVWFYWRNLAWLSYRRRLSLEW
jgi:NADH:ubiquinone oxidoreductase subunit H